MKATHAVRRKVRTESRMEPTHRVHLEYFDPDASQVCVAGTFNDWHPQVTEMVNLGHGRWAKELMLPEGEHEYRLIVDGVWREDPHCPESAPNPFGSHNSLLRVP